MDNADIRNFKDFLQHYNKITETCFLNCVNTLSDRDIKSDELHCVDLCAMKHIRVNHKVMQVYLEVQPTIMNRRVEEMTQAQAIASASLENASVTDGAPEVGLSSSSTVIEQSAEQHRIEPIAQSPATQS